MRSKALCLILLIFLLVSAACTPQATPTAQISAPTSAPATQAPTEQPPATEAPVATAVPPTEAPTEPPAPAKTLTVLAAASLTESFTEIGGMFEAQNPGVKVALSFAGSQQLAQQLAEGAPADVFASASKKYMDASVEAGRVLTETAKVFVKNRLVVIYPTDNPAGLKELKDLAKPGLKLVLAAKEVPVGQYSLDFLDKAITDPAFGSTFKDDVLKNVVSYEENVKAVLTKIVLAEGDAGIVYLSDISQDASTKVGKLEIPDALNVIASYPIAVIADSKEPALAQAFVDLVLSPDGQAVLKKYNFVPVTQASAGPFTITDALDRTVTFQTPPKRIALAGKANLLVADALYLFPEAVERIAVLGKGSQGTGNFLAVIDPQYESKPKFDNEVGPEQLVSATPDAVILKSYLADTLGTPLEAVSLPVVYVDFETPEQYYRDLKTIGQLFQDEARAQKVTEFYTSRVDAISQKTSGLKDEQKLKVLLLYYSDKDGEVAFNVPPMGWIQTWIAETAGGIPVWKDANLGKGWTKVTLEQVAAWDADQIYIISYFKPVGEVVGLLKADPKWQSLRAVKDGKLYGFAGDMMSWDQADTRWILGLTWLATKIQPDLFAGVDILAEAKTFFTEMYGMTEETYQKEIVPLFNGDLP